MKAHPHPIARPGPGPWRAVIALSLGLCACAAFGQATDAQTDALTEALRLGAPKTDRPGLYGDWKVKPAIIPVWSARCLGTPLTPEAFAADPAAARQVVRCVMSQELGRQLSLTGDEHLAVRRAASWWMTGDPEQYDQGGTGQYTDRVLRDYRELLEIQAEGVDSPAR